jgi:hypothetical protein
MIFKLFFFLHKCLMKNKSLKVSYRKLMFV